MTSTASSLCFPLHCATTSHPRWMHKRLDTMEICVDVNLDFQGIGAGEVQELPPDAGPARESEIASECAPSIEYFLLSFLYCLPQLLPTLCTTRMRELRSRRRRRWPLSHIERVVAPVQRDAPYIPMRRSVSRTPTRDRFTLHVRTHTGS